MNADKRWGLALAVLSGALAFQAVDELIEGESVGRIAYLIFASALNLWCSIGRLTDKGDTKR